MRHPADVTLQHVIRSCKIYIGCVILYIYYIVKAAPRKHKRLENYLTYHIVSYILSLSCSATAFVQTQRSNTTEDYTNRPHHDLHIDFNMIATLLRSPFGRHRSTDMCASVFVKRTRVVYRPHFLSFPFIPGQILLEPSSGIKTLETWRQPITILDSIIVMFWTDPLACRLRYGTENRLI
jgi:hypothetical protein